jgi:hypothetical protein
LGHFPSDFAGIVNAKDTNSFSGIQCCIQGVEMIPKLAQFDPCFLQPSTGLENLNCDAWETLSLRSSCAWINDDIALLIRFYLRRRPHRTVYLFLKTHLFSSLLVLNVYQRSGGPKGIAPNKVFVRITEPGNWPWLTINRKLSHPLLVGQIAHMNHNAPAFVDFFIVSHDPSIFLGRLFGEIEQRASAARYIGHNWLHVFATGMRPWSAGQPRPVASFIAWFRKQILY